MRDHAIAFLLLGASLAMGGPARAQEMEEPRGKVGVETRIRFWVDGLTRDKVDPLLENLGRSFPGVEAKQVRDGSIELTLDPAGSIRLSALEEVVRASDQGPVAERTLPREEAERLGEEGELDREVEDRPIEDTQDLERQNYARHFSRLRLNRSTLSFVGQGDLVLVRRMDEAGGWAMARRLNEVRGVRAVPGEVGVRYELRLDAPGLAAPVDEEGRPAEYAPETMVRLLDVAEALGARMSRDSTDAITSPVARERFEDEDVEVETQEIPGGFDRAIEERAESEVLYVDDVVFRGLETE